MKRRRDVTPEKEHFILMSLLEERLKIRNGHAWYGRYPQPWSPAPDAYSIENNRNMIRIYVKRLKELRKIMSEVTV